MQGETLVFDIETNGFLDTVSKVWCIGIGSVEEKSLTLYADQPGYLPISAGIARLQAAGKLVAHNGIKYDAAVLNKLYGPGTVDTFKIEDTLVMARLSDPESKANKLADWGERLGFPKGEWDQWDRWDPAMGDYCLQDVKVTVRVWRQLQKRLDGWWVDDELNAVLCEHYVEDCIARQERNGFKLNVEKAVQLVAELRQEMMDLERELEPIFPPVLVKDGKAFMPKQDNARLGYTAGAPFSRVKIQMFNPGSRPQIEMRLKRKYGWKPTKFTGSGRAEINDQILAELDYPEAISLARYFRVEKQLGQIADGDNGWLKLVTADGRVHGAVNPVGCRTHRMSHFKPNMAQVDKQDLRMREVWEASTGWVLVGSDAEGLELRMLAHYLAKYDGGAYGDSVINGRKEDQTDVHSRTMIIAAMFKRDNAKTLIYAYLYGAGNAKLGRIICEDAQMAGQPRPKGSYAQIGKAVRGRLETGIKGLEALLKAVKKAHKSTGKFKSLDGRMIVSISEHSALNTLLQSAGAVVMKWALVIFDRRHRHRYGTDYRYCANVHDEVQMECRTREIAEEMGKAFAQAITDAGKFLKIRCPLSGSYDIGLNWKETH